MVFELLKYAKSAMKNFDQSGASIVVMWLPKKKSQKTHFWVPFHKFFSRILNNSLEKWDFSKEMSRPKVENKKLREQNSFAKNGQ